MKFQIQINISNYEDGSKTLSNNIELSEMDKFRDLIKTINEHTEVTWNWFSKLPDKWDGESYIYDNFAINYHMNKFFKKTFDPQIIIEFFLKFTPTGADHINKIHIYKIEEIDL